MPGTHGRETPSAESLSVKGGTVGTRTKAALPRPLALRNSLFSSVFFLFLSSSGFALGRDGHQDSGALGTLLPLDGQGSSGTITDFAFYF